MLFPFDLTHPVIAFKDAITNGQELDDAFVLSKTDLAIITSSVL
jgi:hypothetical protein